MNHHCLIKTNYSIKSNKKLKNIFKSGVEDFQIVYTKISKNNKERLSKKNINTIDSSISVS